jgi:hypothetical protein
VRRVALRERAGRPTRVRRGLGGLAWLLLGAATFGTFSHDVVAAERGRDHLKRAKVHLAAADYRRAIDACQREIDESPSAASYAYVTYVYQALDGYVEHLAKTDRWVLIEQLYRSLALTSTQDLIDPPEVLARIAKEMIQDGARRQSDVAAAMAARLDKETVARLWKAQTAWRSAHPDDWWAGVPDEWGW